MASNFLTEQLLMKKAAAEKKLFIAVIGGGKCTPEEAAIAESVGSELAKRGVVLVCGGLGGVMEAACKGALEEGGTTVGILPYENADLVNPYVEIPIVTGMGQARNMVIIRTVQAVIAISGEYGTLSEIAFALKNEKPVIGLNTWSLYKNNQDVHAIIPADNPVDAVEKAIAVATNS